MHVTDGKAVSSNPRTVDINVEVVATYYPLRVNAERSRNLPERCLNLLSEGFENDMMLATEDQTAQRNMSNAAERGEIWKVDSTSRFGPIMEGICCLAATQASKSLASSSRT